MLKSIFVAAATVLMLFVGCACMPHASTSADVVVALNLGMEHLSDLDRLREGLTGEGIPCRIGIVDLNYAPILVDIGDSDRAKSIATELVIRNSLSVRLLKSPTLWGPSIVTNSTFEVWEKGQQVREEEFKLY